jgi:hypothetical protein
MINSVMAIADLIKTGIDKAFPDKDKANELKAGIDTALINADSAELASATQVVIAEASGESWLQRNWRPLTMLSFVGLIAAHWLGFTAPNLSEGQSLALLDIVKVGLGGYVLGRSAEKVAKVWKQ